MSTIDPGAPDDNGCDPVRPKLGLVVGAMMDGALALWPRLTKAQFEEALLHVTGTDAKRRLSVLEMNDLLMDELTRCYGVPLCLGGSDPGAPDLERIAEELASIQRELQGVRRAMEAIAQEAQRWARRSGPPRRPNWPPDPPGVRSRR